MSPRTESGYPAKNAETVGIDGGPTLNQFAWCRTAITRRDTQSTIMELPKNTPGDLRAPMDRANLRGEEP